MSNFKSKNTHITLTSRQEKLPQCNKFEPLFSPQKYQNWRTFYSLFYNLVMEMSVNDWLSRFFTTLFITFGPKIYSRKSDHFPWKENVLKVTKSWTKYAFDHFSFTRVMSCKRFSLIRDSIVHKKYPVLKCIETWKYQTFTRVTTNILFIFCLGVLFAPSSSFVPFQF